MQFIKDNKAYIALIILIVLGFWGYSLYSGGTPSAAIITTTDRSPLSQDVLATLSSLHTITLDSSIFTDPLFVSLSDFGVQIPAEAAGRRNPFAPVQ